MKKSLKKKGKIKKKQIGNEEIRRDMKNKAKVAC